MAKKRPAKKPSGNSKPMRGQRKEPYDSRRVLAIVERLREQAVRLSQLAKTIDDAGVSGLVIDGHAMMVHGLTHVDNFTDNAFRAVREAKTAMLKL